MVTFFPVSFYADDTNHDGIPLNLERTKGGTPFNPRASAASKPTKRSAGGMGVSPIQQRQAKDDESDDDSSNQDQDDFEEPESDADADDEESESQQNVVEDAKATFFVFGKTLHDLDAPSKSVCLRFTGFKPYFFLKLHPKVKPNYSTVSDYFELAEKCLKIRTVIPDPKDSNKSKVKWISLDSHMLPPNDQTLFKSKSLWGFQTEESYFIKFEFSSIWAFNKVSKFFRYSLDIPNELRGFEVHESKLDPLTRFIQDSGVDCAAWTELDLTRAKPARDKVSTCDLEYLISTSQVNRVIKTLHDVKSKPELIQVSFDLEVYSHDHVTFPNPKNPNNPILMIGACYQKTTDTSPELAGSQKHIFHYGECGLSDGYVLHTADTETEVILDFAEWFRELDPDVILHYNGDKFDWEYLMVRCKMLGILQEFGKSLSRFTDYQCWLQTQTFSSSAYGDNIFHRVKIPGRLNIDLLTHIQRNGDQYPMYKLDYVAEKELGEKKNPVSPRMIFEYWASKDSVKREVIARYCVQDTLLVLKLSNKLDALTMLWEMSNVMGVCPIDLLVRGQQVRVYSLLTRKAHRNGFLVPDRNAVDDGSFKGAIVLDPIVGAYRSPVQVSDFASLYPSIMMGYRICYTTIVLDDTSPERIAQLRSEGYVIDSIEWDEDDGTHSQFWYVQNSKSVLPEIEEEMYQARQHVKQLKKHTSDAYSQKVLKMREIAIKVSMNSMYGYTSSFQLPLKPLAASITAMGRQLIQIVKNFYENTFPDIVVQNAWLDHKPPIKIVGGDTDSVFANFPTCTLEQAIFLGQRATEIVTDQVINRKPIKIAYEKTYLPYFLERKKGYIGKLYEEDTTKWRLDYKGIALKRRNYSTFVKKVYREVIDILMNDTVVERANSMVLDTIRTHVQDLLSKRVPLEDLIITGKLAAHYKTENIPHVNLVKRIKERDPGSVPAIGERFEYVFVEPSGNHKQIYELAETVDYAKEHGLKPNALFYINNQLKNPITSFIRLLGQDTLDKCVCIFDEAVCIAQKDQDGQQTIFGKSVDFVSKPLGLGHYGKKAKKTATRTVSSKTVGAGTTSGGLDRFFKRPTPNGLQRFG